MASAEKFALVQVDNHHIWLGNPNFDWPEYTDGHIALDPQAPDGLYLETGTHTGLVGLAIEVHDLEPAISNEDWPEQETVSLFLSSTDFFAVPLAGGGDELEVVLPRPGHYKVRAAWAVRPDEDEDVEEGSERYLIQLWPAG